MSTHPHHAALPIRVAVGVTAGALLAAVDAYAFEGEASPVLIAALLLVATLAMGIAWGRAAWVATLITGLAVPLLHLVKHVLGRPDTLTPNTYTSILWLAAFTLVVTTVGTSTGLLIHRMGRATSRAPRRRP